MHDTSVFNANSPQAQAIKHLFYVDLIICGIILLVVTALVFVAIIRFRHRPGREEPFQDPGNPKLETLWTVIPALILVFLLILTARTMHTVNPPTGTRSPDVVVTAHQWWWEYRYPKTGAVTANELHMPMGVNWLLGIESADVIHDFWVPDLGAKMDAIPGHPNSLWIQPARAGTYLGTCAEYCGCGHAMMGIRVIVEPLAEFQAWEQHLLQIPPAPTGTVEKRGARLFAERTCINCHTVAGTTAKGHVGPDLTHMGDRQTLAAGVLDNTPDHLAQWIMDPQRIKPKCNMPSLGLTPADAHDIAVYLEGLK